MRFKIILLAYFVVAVLTSAISFYQFSKYVNPDTGFFIVENNNYGLFISVIAIFLVLAAVVFSLFVRRCPLKQPELNINLFLSSAFMALIMIFKSINIFGSESIDYLSAVINIVCALFFLVYASTFFLFIKFSEYLSIIPLIYWLVNLVVNYLNISKMQIIPENAYLILANAFTVIFMLNFAKLSYKISSPYLHKAILATGICASCFSFMFFVSGIYMNLAHSSNRNDTTTLFIYLINGLFILTFICSFFDNHNLKHRHKHSGSHTILPHDSAISNTSNESGNESENT